MDPDAIIFVFWMLSFKPAFSLYSFPFIKSLFHSSFVSSIRLLSLQIWGYWCFSHQSWFQLVLHPSWHFAWCTLHRSWMNRVAIYSLDVLLSQFGTSPLFHVQFYLLLLDLCTDFSGGGSSIPISKNFPQFVMIYIMKGFSIVNQSRCFSRILLLFQWSNGCWQFDLWFLSLC